jgi:hypothetical protein
LEYFTGRTVSLKGEARDQMIAKTSNRQDSSGPSPHGPKIPAR